MYRGFISFNMVMKSALLAGSVLIGGHALALSQYDVSNIETSQSAYDKVPEKIRKSNKLIVGSEIGYAPYEFFAEDGNTAVGVDVDLLLAVGKKLGLEIDLLNTEFSTYMPGLAGNRFDAVTAIADTPSRREQMGFVTYIKAGASLMTLPGYKDDLEKLEDLCGAKVGYLKGAIQQNHLEEQSEKCTADDKAPIDIQVFPNTNVMTVALTTKRVDAIAQDYGPGIYANEQRGNIFTVHPPYIEYTFGFGFPKNADDLKDAFVEAFEELRDEGVYDDVLKKWGLEDAAIEKFENVGS